MVTCDVRHTAYLEYVVFPTIEVERLLLFVSVFGIEIFSECLVKRMSTRKSVSVVTPSPCTRCVEACPYCRRILFASDES